MSVAKRYQAEEEERNRRKILYLLLFSSSPLRYGEIKEYVGLSDAVLTAHLRELTMRGFIAKVIREGDLKPAYTLTRSGEEYLSKLYESESEEALKVKTLYDEVYQRLRNSGFAAAIQKESNMLEALTIVSPLIKIVRIFRPGKIEDEYLNFASKIYVDSVEEFLGRKKEELSYIDIRAAWQTINQSAWKERKDIPGLSFNYPAAWKINYQNTSSDLRRRLKERYGSMENQQYRLFRRLKIWSFPATERGKIMKILPLKPSI